MQASSRGLSIGVPRVVIPPGTVRSSIGMTRVVIPTCMRSQVAHRVTRRRVHGHSTTHRQGFIHVPSSSLVSLHPLLSYGYSCSPYMHLCIQYCQIQVPWLLFIRRCSSSIGGITRPAPVVGPSANQLSHHCCHVIVAVTWPRFIGVGAAGALLIFTRYAGNISFHTVHSHS